jgi:hypothetical protein
MNGQQEKLMNDIGDPGKCPNHFQGDTGTKKYVFRDTGKT